MVETRKVRNSWVVQMIPFLGFQRVPTNLSMRFWDHILCFWSSPSYHKLVGFQLVKPSHLSISPFLALFWPFSVFCILSLNFAFCLSFQFLELIKGLLASIPCHHYFHNKQDWENLIPLWPIIMNHIYKTSSTQKRINMQHTWSREIKLLSS